MNAEEGLKGISWRVMVLPFLEQMPLYQQIEPLPDGGATNWKPELWAVDGYLCPSAPAPTSNGTTQVISHYAAVSGAYRGNERLDLEDDQCGDIYTNGIFYPDSRTKIARITDGTSNTLAVGERLYIFRSWMNGSTWQGGAPPSQICSDASKNIRWPINAGGYWKGDFGAPSGQPKDLLLNDLVFASWHPGGAQFGFADGSVHFIRETIDFTIYQNLATKSGDEPVEHDF